MNNERFESVYMYCLLMMAFLLFNVSQPALGQDIDCDDSMKRFVEIDGFHIKALERLERLECVGRSSDRTNYIALIQNEIKDSNLNVIDIDKSSMTALKILSDHFQDSAYEAGIQDVIQAFSLDGPLAQSLDLRYWGNSHPAIQTAKTHLIENCHNRQLGNKCKELFEQAGEAVRYVNSVANIINYKQTPLKLGIGKIYQNRVNMWNDYIDNALPQWPWEFYLTGLANKDNREGIEEGIPKGPRKPPNWQIRALHFTTGFAVVDAQESTFSPTVYAEIVGINRLHWDIENGKLKGGLGASIIAAYTPDARKDIGYGIMLHLNNKYSLSVIKNDGDYGVIASLDVVELFQKSFGSNYIKKNAPIVYDLMNR